MNLFPKWAEYLRLGDCEIKGVDFLPNDETKNYQELLNGDNLTYTLNMASFDDDGKLIANGINIELTKQENFESNPIQIEKIITSKRSAKRKCVAEPASVRANLFG